VEQLQVQNNALKLQDVIAVVKPSFNDAECWELEDLLTKYRDIFPIDSDEYGQTDRVYHRIDTGGPNRFSNPREDSPWQNRWMQVRCSRTCNNMGLLRSQTAPSHPPSSSRRRTWSCASA
jgi:hypothetical protein